MTASAETARPRSRVRLTPRAAILVLLLIGLLLYMVVPLKAYMAERSRLTQLEQQTQVLEQQNEALRTQVHKLHDPGYIERLARCQGMVRPGEIAFVVVPHTGAADRAC